MSKFIEEHKEGYNEKSQKQIIKDNKKPIPGILVSLWILEFFILFGWFGRITTTPEYKNPPNPPTLLFLCIMLYLIFIITPIIRIYMEKFRNVFTYENLKSSTRILLSIIGICSSISPPLLFIIFIYCRDISIEFITNLTIASIVIVLLLSIIEKFPNLKR